MPTALQRGDRGRSLSPGPPLKGQCSSCEHTVLRVPKVLEAAAFSVGPEGAAPPSAGRGPRAGPVTPPPRPEFLLCRRLHVWRGIKTARQLHDGSPVPAGEAAGRADLGAGHHACFRPSLPGPGLRFPNFKVGPGPPQRQLCRGQAHVLCEVPVSLGAQSSLCPQGPGTSLPRGPPGPRHLPALGCGVKCPQYLPCRSPTWSHGCSWPAAPTLAGRAASGLCSAASGRALPTTPSTGCPPVGQAGGRAPEVRGPAARGRPHPPHGPETRLRGLGDWHRWGGRGEPPPASPVPLPWGAGPHSPPPFPPSNIWGRGLSPG